jgi:hypothetical protein
VPAEEAAAQGEQATTRGKPGAPGARAKQTRPAAPAATDAAANPKPQQATTASAPASARPARTARQALNPQEKEALFQQFLTWRQERRQAPETSR